MVLYYYGVILPFIYIFAETLKNKKLMKGITKQIGIAGMACIMLYSSSCATITGGRIGACQKTKPEEGQPRREIKTGKLVWDVVLGSFTLGFGIPVFVGIDFLTGAIYKPCGESIKIDTNTGEVKRKKFVK